jgi:four helix bundle protein
MSKDQPDIRERSFGCSLRAIKPYQVLQQGKDGAGWVLGKQYLRAATSVGANVEEAQSAESRPDFVHKYGIAQKEARESLYWLKSLAESGIIPSQRLRPLVRSVKCKG